MVTPYSCPNCGAVADGERCAKCGTQLVLGSSSDERLSVAAPGLVFDGGLDQSVEAPRKRVAAAYLSLEPSETAVLHAASRILAGHIAAGTVTADNEDAAADRAVRQAARMALVIEKYVQSDGEDW
ncbi:MAG: hypothetical protein H0V17_00280 [Deltaproteobacteria bacterium]|nr:hypothetical protein [Deltaproteobacteria bacterium]